MLVGLSSCEYRRSANIEDILNFDHNKSYQRVMQDYNKL